MFTPSNISQYLILCCFTVTVITNNFYSVDFFLLSKKTSHAISIWVQLPFLEQEWSYQQRSELDLS